MPSARSVAPHVSYATKPADVAQAVHQDQRTPRRSPNRRVTMHSACAATREALTRVGRPRQRRLATKRAPGALGRAAAATSPLLLRSAHAFLPLGGRAQAPLLLLLLLFLLTAPQRPHKATQLRQYLVQASAPERSVHGKARLRARRRRNRLRWLQCSPRLVWSP